MRTFQFGDEKITSREIMIAVPSMLIAAGMIKLPRQLAEKTLTIDGVVAILVAGFLAAILTWMITKLVSHFPNQSFLSYSSYLVTKPIAMVLTFLYILQGIMLTAFQIREVAFISHQYLFDATPIEIVGLSFLLVVIYAVSGSRAGIFRLNVMFLPIIILSVFLMMIFSVGYMEVKNVIPVLKTGVDGYFKATIVTSTIFAGVGILFFYMEFVKDPKKVPRKAVGGIVWVVTVALVVYITCLAVFGQATTEVIRFPVVELAKTVKIPGGFLERLESLLFVIWLMVFFTTTMMAFDVSVLAIQSIFKKLNKVKIIFILAPCIFLIATMPRTYVDNERFGFYINYFGLVLSVTTVLILSIAFKFKGRKANGK